MGSGLLRVVYRKRCSIHSSSTVQWAREKRRATNTGKHKVEGKMKKGVRKKGSILI